MKITEFADELVNAVLPERKPESHKGDYGRILLICGSRKYTGAPYLAAMGALRSGAGLVYLAVPESIYTIEACKLTEPIIIPLKDTQGKLSEEATSQILELLPRMDAVLIGPGIGQSEDAFGMVKTVLQVCNGPVVVDADGINLLSGHMDIVRGRNSPTILTPHIREFERVGGRIDGDRTAAAATFASKWNCVLLLKGHQTIITDGNTCYMNPTGNPGMAVGGSGDLLAGIIVSFLGQGISPMEAAGCAAYLHGRAGDICAHEIGQYGMLPTDMLNVLPRLMK